MARTAPERTPGAHPHPDLRRVGDGGVRAEHPRVHLHRPADPADSRRAWSRRTRGRYFAVAGAVLLTVIVVRIAWHMSFNAVVRWRDRRFGFHPPRPMLRPTVGSGLVISWAGMRGIVSLAAALALPAAFPFRDLIVLTAFSVVLGTLVIQGLTLKPLLRALDLRDDDPVGREVARGARTRAARRPGERSPTTTSPVAEAVRQEFTAHLAVDVPDADGRRRSARVAHGEIHRAGARGGAAGGARHARQRRDRRRCVSSDRRGAGLARDGESTIDRVTGWCASNSM